MCVLEGDGLREGFLEAAGQSRVGDGCRSRSGHGVEGAACAGAQQHEHPRRCSAGPLRHADAQRFAPAAPASGPREASPLPGHRGGPPPHLLQRPWAGCALLLTEAGREHLWHTHSFPLKVTRSPGGKGILQRGTASPARTLTPPGGGGPLARHMPSAPLGAHAQAPQAEDTSCSTQA